MTISTEQFEILSAYLDDEASGEECRLVEQWLDCDPSFRQQYQAQRRLRAAIRSLSASSLLDVENVDETDIADSLADLESKDYSTRQFADKGMKNRNVERAGIENLQPDEFSMHRAIATDEFSSAPLNSHQANHQSVCHGVADSVVSNTSSNFARQRSTILCLLPVLKDRNLIAILVALLATLTAFSFSSVRISLEGDRVRRIPGKATEADSLLFHRKPLILFSVD